MIRRVVSAGEHVHRTITQIYDHICVLKNTEELFV